MLTLKNHLLIQLTTPLDDHDPQAKVCKLTRPELSRLKVARLSIRKAFPIHMYSPLVHSHF